MDLSTGDCEYFTPTQARTVSQIFSDRMTISRRST